MSNMNDLYLYDRMPSMEMIVDMLYSKHGEGLHEYAYCIRGSDKIHQGRMSIEVLENGIILGFDYGSKLSVSLGMVGQ